MEVMMQFKTGTGWKACSDEKRGFYSAEYGGGQNYDLYEITKEIYDQLDETMTEGDASSLISEGRHLYMSVNDRCGPPYTVEFDHDYRTLCPWADIVGGGKVWPDELTNAAVELFASEKNNRKTVKKKR